MKYLFTDTGKQLLESLSFTRTLFAFDFDGTLAPIVSNPENAMPSKTTTSLLTELSKLAPTTVISGRSVADLRPKVKIHGNLLIGNHGVEGLGVKKQNIATARKICNNWVNQLNILWKKLDTDPGTTLENKTYSLALHYRNSRNKSRAKIELFSIIESLQPPPRVILGKCVMNLIPPGGPHKGVALLEAMMQLDIKCAIYIGDDDTDEDVFSLPDSRILTVRIGKKLSSQAQFYLKRQSEINLLLKTLISNQIKNR